MKKLFLMISIILVPAFVFSGCQRSSTEKKEEETVKSVTLSIKHITEIMKPPRKKDAAIWIPIPKNDHEQEVSEFNVDSRFPYTIDEDPEQKNRMLFIRTDDLKAGDKITLSYKVTRKAAGIINDPAEQPDKYLKPTEWEAWDEDLEEYVDKLLGDEKDPVETGRKVYHAIIGMLDYIHEICGRGASMIIFEEKTGRCDEYHALFRSMMMYKGIPVRWEQGMMLPYPLKTGGKGEFEADCINARSWAKFYIGDGRWMPVDLSEGERHPELRDYYFGHLLPDRIKFSTGRGLTLKPAQENIINTFPYTHLEAGGLPAIYGHNYKNILRYEVIKGE